MVFWMEKRVKSTLWFRKSTGPCPIEAAIIPQRLFHISHQLNHVPARFRIDSRSTKKCKQFNWKRILSDLKGDIYLDCFDLHCVALWNLALYVHCVTGNWQDGHNLRSSICQMQTSLHLYTLCAMWTEFVAIIAKWPFNEVEWSYVSLFIVCVPAQLYHP